MKRGSRTGRLPVGNIGSNIGSVAGRLPGRRRSSGLSRITKNVPGGGRAAGTAGGVLLGAGAAVAAGRAISGRRDSSAEQDDKSGKKKSGKSSGKSGGNAEHNGSGLLGRIKDTAGDALPDSLPGVGDKGKGKGKGGKSGKKVKTTNIVEQIDIGAPRRLVYDQWTQLQDFPSFMKKVVSVEQADETKLHWKAKVFWSSRTWESTIIEQVPDEHIVWRSKGSKGHVDGTVSFHKLSPNLTRVLLVLEYHPQGLFERTGNLWRAQGRRVRLELKHFRRYVMTQSLTHPDDVEGWRGEIHDSEVVRTHEEALKEEEREYEEAH
ncbi:SRPBCC family protein [Actinomadura decatromicini]|uniref:SRPBCC family protein n=1 Tax=Actinomadura decatromicini TaxID=2604572 RepID=A0A5D3FZ08_9ACTN|nr:SRPBCC family protein [Actinomadura decatromicini]TYK53262.1 SRPBCC family protein [Actinomadura decatromicini]